METRKQILCEIVPDFLNNFFANISERVCEQRDARPFVPGHTVGTKFVFSPPEMYEIILFAEDIDVNSAVVYMELTQKYAKRFCCIFLGSLVWCSLIPCLLVISCFLGQPLR